MSTKLKILCVSVVVVLGLISSTKATTSQTSYVKEEAQESIRTVQKTVASSSEIPEVLYRIALCESNNRQFTPTGDIVRGRANRLDLGRFQINEYWNGAEAKRLGYDLYTLKGNTAMALHLYKLHGTRDWNWSKFCWDRPLDVILKDHGALQEKK